MVNRLQHALGILDIRRTQALLLLLHHKPNFLDQRNDLISRQLETARVRNARRVTRVVLTIAVVVMTMVARRIVLEVPQQRADVDEHAAGLEAAVDRLQIADEIRRGVEEENGGDGVVGVCVLFVAVQTEEVGGTHGHLADVGCGGEDGAWVDVGDFAALKVASASFVVGKGVDPKE